MSLALAVFVVLTFAAVLGRIGLAGRAREAAARASDCLRILRDSSLGDDAKERRLRKHARRLFGLAGILLGGSALALVVPLGAVWSLDRLGAASLSDVLSVLQRADFLGGTAVMGLLAFLILGREAGS